ncbi:EF-hand domain-containing protein [Coralloluteibacterium thermophilus]|uniref:EF-hand domain-containing protein n=1 Tax=Coralloluteibacterium thermophilum TaxID=2707049 RepID=A0ABV9NNC7_9GAMM
MSRTPLRIALSLALAAVGGAAIAQDAPVRGERQAPARDVATLEQHARDRAAAIDANNDGYITAEEVIAHRDAQRLRMEQRRLERMGGSDGRISVADYEAAQLERIARLDADGDGQISREEFRAQRPGGKGHFGHGRRGGPAAGAR